jgi:hypothetical protein
MNTLTISRRRTLAVVAVVALVGLAWWLSRADDTATSVLPARTVQAGDVEVILTPVTLDASGAVFRVELDTHTTPLDLDMAASARLRVNDTTTSDTASWDGQRPGGHHREGTLRFTTPVPAAATVELRITGLPADVTVSWSAS